MSWDDEDGNEALRVPEALTGRSWKQIWNGAEYGEDEEAAFFVARVKSWAEWRMNSYYKGGTIPSEQETWTMVRRSVDGQAAAAHADLALEQAKERRDIAILASLAAEEKQARIDGERDAKIRHAETVKWAKYATYAGIVSVLAAVVGIIGAG
jgi:hypothetical protein